MCDAVEIGLLYKVVAFQKSNVGKAFDANAMNLGRCSLVIISSRSVEQSNSSVRYFLVCQLQNISAFCHSFMRTSKFIELEL